VGEVAAGPFYSPHGRKDSLRLRSATMTHLMRRSPFGLCPVVLVACVSFSAVLLPLFVSVAQDAPLDASEISRDLLYAAPSRIERRWAGDTYWYALAGQRFEYAWLSFGPPKNFQWQVQPLADASAAKATRQKGVFPINDSSLFELVGHSDDDRATLALRKKGTPDALSTVTLWDRDQLVEAWLPEKRKEKRGTTADGLRQDLEIADPEVRATAELILPDKSAQDQPILVAVGQSTGEGELGLATIVRFDPHTLKATVYHPAGSLTCEVSAIGVNISTPKASPTVWFGTKAIREGTISPCGGLAKVDLQTRSVTPVSGGKNPPIGSIVTLLTSTVGNGFGLVTDAGICNSVGTSESDWKCWRFVPTVTLKDAAAVANRPGDKPYGQLKAGYYEVLWANQNYLEVATPDSFDAWLAADDFAEAAAHNFDVEPYKLLNTTSGGPAPIRPLAKPGGEPLNGALVYRAPLEKLAAPAGTPAGWVKVRARVGWIAREKLEVVPKLAPTKN
jgi:hypothetical protein